MQIVIDTNIWVSGLLWKGDSWRLLKLAEQGEVELCIAYPMLLELEEVLSYEGFQERLSALQETPSQLTAYALSLASAFDVPLGNIPIVEADPDDDIILLCAYEANAQYIISNDRHLLAMKSFQGIPILKISDFLKNELKIA